MIKRNYILFLIPLFMYCCTDERQKLNNDDLLFPDSERIIISPYNFTVENVEYRCEGDTLYFTGQKDTFPDAPVFKWDSLGFTYLTLAIFNEYPDVSNSQINNSDAVVWQWHSGMDLGKEGDVELSDGKNVKNGEIMYNEETLEFLPSGDYYWAVWGWNNSGVNIIYSSRIMRFIVNP
jgi:hypothetical protein